MQKTFADVRKRFLHKGCKSRSDEVAATDISVGMSTKRYAEGVGGSGFVSGDVLTQVIRR
jgi:hypothetical protein